MGSAFTILFVEDDDQVRDTVVQLLSLKGFRVLAANHGYAALRILAEQRVDVLFTDVAMRGLNGIELVKQAKLCWPELKIILATGNAVRAHEAIRLGKLLVKPLRAQQIEAEIRELLTIR